jgi:3-deoxy-D-manno-octulosonate 8-phosphate phosphatase (KDO 8-P phosphatase)
MKKQRLPALLVFDFDGVLTDNRVLVMEDGREAVFCSRSDGLAFDMFRTVNLPVLILSTEKNKVVASRARKLRVSVIHGAKDKRQSLVEYCRRRKVNLQEVAFVGNDLNDLEVMGAVGFPICPADAHPKVLKLARVVLRAKGGFGVARELAEKVFGLRYQGAKV